MFGMNVPCRNSKKVLQDFSMFLTFRTSTDRRLEMHEATKHESAGKSGKLRWIPVKDRAYWDYYSYYSPYWSVNMMAPVDCVTSPREESGTKITSPTGDLPESEPEVLSTASDKVYEAS